jgi:type IV pilus assembly protein PilE
MQLALVLVAAAVVVAVGVPIAHQRALREDRLEARRALRNIQAAEERYLVQHNRYAASLTSAPPAGLGLPARSSRGHYALSLEVSDALPAPSFTARALNLRSGTDPHCASLSLTHEGLRDARDVTGADRTDECWQ